MLRVRSITPIDVPPEELARRQQRYARLSPPQLTVTLDNVGDGAPTALENDSDIRASDEQVGHLAATTDPAQFDIVVPDCVLDPGVDAHGEVPVVGLLRLAAGHCSAFDGRFGSVTRNPAIGDELSRRLREYGLDQRYVGNEVLALDLDAVADGHRWRSALTIARDRLAQRGADAVLNGCSAVNVDRNSAAGPRLAEQRPVTARAVVFDPTRLALELLAAGHRAGLAMGRVRRGRGEPT